MTPVDLPGYAVEHVLGRGHGEPVWAAQRVRDGRPVALKRLVAGADTAVASGLATELSLLTRAAETACDAGSIVPLLDAVPTPAGDVVLVMERMSGGSLLDLLGARGHLSAGECVTVLAPVATAVAGLHEHGVVHADLAPGNILFDDHGRPVLADFGVATVIGAEVTEVFGTVGFASPEMRTGSDPSPAADCYALGALGWYCLTGEPPGSPGLRESGAAVLQHLGAGAEELALMSVMEQALDADPAARPSAREVALAVFDAVPAQPVRLSGRGDESALVTRRIRGANGSPPAAVPGDDASPPRGRLGPGTWGRMAALLGRGAAATGARQRVARRLGWAVVAAVTLVAVGVGGWRATAWTTATSTTLSPTTEAMVSTRAEATTSAPGPATTATPAHTGPTTPGNAEGLAILTRHEAPRRDPTAVITALATLRAAAWNRASDELLQRLDAPGSEALAQDRALLGEHLAAGASYRGVGFVVTDAALVARVDESTVRLRASVATLPHVVSAAAGESRVPGTEPVDLVFGLRWNGARWQVAEIDAAD